MMHYASLLSFLFLTFTLALANTEIVNFEANAARNFDIWFVREWPTLNHAQPRLEWNLTANPLDTPKSAVNKDPCVRLYHWSPTTVPENCIQELWLAVDLDAKPWASYTKFTVRLSWSAEYPVDAYLKIFDSSDIAPLPRPGPPRRLRNRPRSTNYHVRRKFARIQLVNTGVLNPKHELAKSQDPNVLPHPVPLIIQLEPLIFGVLPESMVPTVFAIIGAAGVGIFIARAVIGRLESDEERAKSSATGQDKKVD
ncbi:hypothetical protein DFP72DRAFT_899629 [Ephemerocybe angulata]|uniref:Uncharacterized protein n=1 Tax=Ephemerocybe angulata TaxID=980116 RepID=A0A8H6HXK7_9AGAR|nr:hypothetical protein DFP72DRAFT_899629 [Tulosesus angulatus]